MQVGDSFCSPHATATATAVPCCRSCRGSLPSFQRLPWVPQVWLTAARCILKMYASPRHPPADKSSKVLHYLSDRDQSCHMLRRALKSESGLFVPPAALFSRHLPWSEPGGLANFTVKCHRGNVLHTVGHMASVTRTQICGSRVQLVVHDTYMCSNTTLFMEMAI